MPVYFIHHNGHIKIGVSVDPWGRLSSLQTAHHERLEMLAIMPGEAADEREIHQRFARLRVTGEWFRDSQELREFVQLVRENNPDLQEPSRQIVEPPAPSSPRFDDAKVNEICALFDTFVHFGGAVQFLDQPDRLLIGLPGVKWSGENTPDNIFIVSYDDKGFTPKLKREVKPRTLTDRLNTAAAFVIYFHHAQMATREGYGVILQLNKAPAPTEATP